jgi:AcrR family transcriptional regulator
MSDAKREAVLAAARQVFMRYGYRRVTMGDIADAAKMSRPALYLVIPSKEEIFTAVLSQTFAEMLGKIRQDIGSFHTAREKLNFAFEIWFVGPCELIQKSPDAKDLLESGYEFSAEVVTNAFADFESILTDILEPLVRSQSTLRLSAVELSKLLTNSVMGQKRSANGPSELRHRAADLISIVLASVGAAN